MWPDFGADDFEFALNEFARRDRRFGRIDVAPYAAEEIHHV
jgi:hypothetical protein